MQRDTLTEHEILVEIALISSNFKLGQCWWKTKNWGFIGGGSVYKMLAGDGTQDVDVVTLNPNLLLSYIKRTYPNAFNDHENVIFLNPLSNIYIDVVSIPDYIKSMNYSGLNMTNALVLDKERKIRHILEIQELKEGLNDFMEQLYLSEKCPKKERKWVKNKIKNKEYCLTYGLRQKDMDYFLNSGWKKIDAFECKQHGMFT